MKEDQKIMDKKLHDSVSKFLEDNEGKDMTVYINPKSGSKISIVRFQISGKYRELVLEDDSLNICEYGQPMLIPDMVSIPYDEVVSCTKRPVLPGDDYPADVMEILLKSGIVIELGFSLI